MSPQLRTAPYPQGRRPPNVDGIKHLDSEWILQLDYYDDFISDVTGIETSGGLSTRELKTVQTRLDGCLEALERSGDCVCNDFERYDHVDSIEIVHELARFFRAAVAGQVEQ